MTDAWSHRLGTHEQSVRVAIHSHFADFQDMPARFAFLPELVPRATEEYDFTCPLRFRKSGRIHESQHQYITGAHILNNRGHQAVAFLKIDLHVLLLPGSNPKTKIPLGLSAPAG
jgi:hypothetical protein